MLKKFITTAIVGFGLSAAGPASAIVVGGVDFGAQGATNTFSTTTLAQTNVTGEGQTVIGYGQVNTVNGNLAYAGTSRLYFTFSYDVLSFSSDEVTFNNGKINLYLLDTYNTLDKSSPDNMTHITTTGTLFGAFEGHARTALGAELVSSGTVTGSTIDFRSFGFLDIVGGMSDVVEYFDVNNIDDSIGGFADVSLTSSGNNEVLNNLDVLAGLTAGCLDGTAAAGSWCIAGSADYRHTLNPSEVPEPNVLALLGISLFAFVPFVRRREKNTK